MSGTRERMFARFSGSSYIDVRGAIDVLSLQKTH
jgi:hypothetical protein